MAARPRADGCGGTTPTEAGCAFIVSMVCVIKETAISSSEKPPLTGAGSDTDTGPARATGDIARG